MQLNTPHEPSAAPSKPVEVRGVFSTQEIRRVGTGTTTRKTVQKTFWFVEQKGQDIECQPLNPNYIPSGPKRKISMDELIAKFSPEPEFYMNSVYPKMQELKKTISSADRQRENGNNFTAEYEYSRALKVDEENVRANFGIGLTYLERGDKAKAQDIFERLVKLDGAFQAEHKHLFNDFGINLRKNKMLTQALEYYKRAQELSPNDENLYMNIARVQLESHNIDDCIANLLKALSLDPHHAPSLKFVAWLIKKNMVPEKHKADLAAAIAASKKAPEKTPEAPAAQQTPPAAAAAPAAAPAAQHPATPPAAAAPAAQQRPAPAPQTTAAPVAAAQAQPHAAAARPPQAQKAGTPIVPVKNLGAAPAAARAAVPPVPPPPAQQAARLAAAPTPAPRPAPAAAPAAPVPPVPPAPAAAPAPAAPAAEGEEPKEDVFKGFDGLF